MIEQLYIRNLVLIEEATLQFGTGLNILTGETGAGKSAVLSAIRLILGERADVGLVGKKGELAIVEATVSIPTSVHIRREIHRSGKNRCFVNDELVSLAELRALFCDAIELADQGAAYKLSEPDELRKLLDVFGKHDVAAQAGAFHACQKDRLALAELHKHAEDMQREEDHLREQLTLLDRVDWKPGEEEELTATHSLLSRTEKSAEKLSELASFLSEGAHPILPLIKRFAGQMESLQFSELSAWLQTAKANLEEVSLFLSSYLANVDLHSQQLATVEERICQIESIKRRLAKTPEEAALLQNTLRAKLDRLDQMDEEIARAEQAEKYSAAHLSSLETKLTQSRICAAQKLQASVLAELHELNMPDAKLHIQIDPHPSSPTGADEVRWLFSANLGQPLLPLHQSASGGELSRILLAVKLALKETKCLILDEIDGNVGGLTSAKLGLKLKELGAQTQIICVTHFVQVAKHAMHHFLVSKKNHETGTFTTLQKLGESGKSLEYARMTGSIS